MPKKKRKASYTEVLSTLTDVLSEREKDLDAREEKLQEERELFDKERSTDYGETTPSDVLHLNIGGTKTTVLRRTLTSVPGSMLASRFSGRWDDSIEKDKDGDFFIDQEYSLFIQIINYLRKQANGAEKYPIPNTLYGIDIYRMLEYYGMTDGIYPVKLIALGSKDSVEMLSSKKVNAKEWTTFRLVSDSHIRHVGTFEVTLGTVQRIQIGWEITPYWEDANNSLKNGNLGAGDIDYTFALDLTRSNFLIEGEPTTIDGLDHPTGTVVRSENNGKVWYINGELLAPFSEEKWWNKHEILNPIISIKGEFEVTSVEFDG